SRSAKHLAAWHDGRPQSRDIVAERGAEATGFEKIALHVDDHQRRFVQVDRNRLGFGFKIYARHHNLLGLQWLPRCKIEAITVAPQDEREYYRPSAAMGERQWRD